MNPLDLMGPDFLRFYLIYGIGILAVAGLLRVRWAGASTPSPGGRWVPGSYPRESDAYAIALLRGGPREAVCALFGRLVTGGYLTLDQGVLRRPEEPPEDRSRLLPIEEEALLLAASSGADGVRVHDARERIAQAVAPRLEEMRRELESQGLMPGPQQRRRYRAVCLLALAAVLGLGIAKLVVALSRGRTNVWYLIALMLVYAVACVLLLIPPRLTHAGRRYLDWLRESHRGLVNLLVNGRRAETEELALAAGIYGLAALPALSPLDTALAAHGPVRPDRHPHPGSSSGASSGGGGSGCGGGDSGISSVGGGDSGGSSCGGGDSGGDSGGDGGGGSCGGGCGGGGCGGCGGG